MKMKISSLWLYIIFFLLQYQAGFSLPDNTTKTLLCREEQRQLLLQLKQELPPASGDDYKTKYWNQSSDCCLWDGVTCDQSGRVIELDLSFSGLTGNTHSNSTLFRLTHLQRLDLTCSAFWGPIPKSIGNLTELTEIVFVANQFSSQVPSTISNLRHLTDLYLSYNHLEGQLPDAFSDLQKLEVLYLDHNSLGGIIPSSVTNMSQLEVLDMSSNALNGTLPSTVGHGLQKLRHLYLSNNSIQGMIPSWLLSLPLLYSLDLSSNRLSGQIGKFNRTSLRSLLLSDNQLNIELNSFYNHSIVDLSLSYNTVTEHAPEIVNITLPNLCTLELSSCEIKEFPYLLRNLTNLNWLDLSNNKIHGRIPRWFSSLSGLQLLKLSSNYLTYTGYEPWQQFEYLHYFDLHSNSFGGTFPSSICNASSLQILDLSDNKLRGKIPECIRNFSSELSVLDLRKNEFHGNIPTTIGENDYLLYLGLSDNHLEGPLPRSLANCTHLEVLDLGNNIIQDTFPRWLQNLPQLKILLLRSNRFHGSIRPPISNNSFSELQIIDLSYNNFTGRLPEKFFARLQAMKYQDQAERDGLYLGRYYLDNWRSDRDLGHESYQYTVTLSQKGVDRDTGVFRFLTAIDLSSNNFYGHIPESMAYLCSLRLLNLSRNSINGSIPAAMGRMTNLEQLDLSSNQLTGGIPQTLTNLTFLAVLNLSYNDLVGHIPEGHQFPTFPNDSYIGNSKLCGAPLTKKCGNDRPPPSPLVSGEEEDDDDSGLMMGFTWKAVVMGYGCGMVFGFILGNVMISIGKPEWFARFYYVEEANCLRRKKRGRMVQGRK